MVSEKKTKVEESQTCQTDLQIQGKKDTNQTAKKGMVPKAKEAMEARQAPGSLQHTRPT